MPNRIDPLKKSDTPELEEGFKKIEAILGFVPNSNLIMARHPEFEVAITATQSLDDVVLANWFKKNKVDTIVGRMRFDGANNYGDDHLKIKQVQRGRWVTVWPKEFAAPGATIRVKS